ncbi:3-isopropylmalate dehydratase small subunit [Aestuariivita sp.]|jgi:3-isopropylmalate/(R)-2-methylmalate dehydratase small subunit|uniref:3-isopropylmalate dehydratase small subunit n=1 Tax=Aestuariivita sp. TaxID=1872407 RepID=UPI00216D6539|nr:3-isopropylmalate dehydratase small subunit [Aestuariivita sp.]MCE8006019.1 3-isopropylmalate dehydratase small subunit [Aestuariivita sp.]
MSAFPRLTASPARLPLDNVDTDQLIPARFMSRARSEGYGAVLLHDLRKKDPAARLPDGASILIAGRNFGCGSSREAAVYALFDFGIRVVLAPSFGDIFASNAVNNGVLPAVIPADRLARLEGEITVDLERVEITHSGGKIGFEIDPVWRTKLLNGWDDIDLTAQHAQAIASFKAAHHARAPWTRPMILG